MLLQSPLLRLVHSLPAAVFAVCALCTPALQPSPAFAVPKLDSGLGTVQDRMRGLLNSVEFQLQRRPRQIVDLEARERRRPLRRSDRVGRASYGAILDGASRLQDQARLHFVNSVWNSLRYASDRELYGRDDYWATPAETASRGAGDCEDFAIAKYYTLRDLGQAAESLRLMLVTLRGTGEPHMLVCVRGKGEARCLDNRHRRLLSDGEAALVYKPLFSASESRSVMHLSPAPKPKPRPEVRLAANAESNVQSRAARTAGRPRF